MQYQPSCAPKLARKCEIEHWLPCGADGRAVYGHVITTFSGMGKFTYPWCSTGALCAPELRYNLKCVWCDTGDFTNQNATQPETSPEVICSQSASLRMLGAKLQRVFFTFRTRGWHLQRFQKTWVVSTEFDLELNFLLLPYRQNCFSKSMKMLFIVKKFQTNILICLLLQVNWLPLWWMDNTQTRRVRYQSRKLASKSNLVY